METLAYWNLRAVEARIAFLDSGTKADREDLIFTRRMVKIVESILFIERV
jgi:hypothetical protein